MTELNQELLEENDKLRGITGKDEISEEQEEAKEEKNDGVDDDALKVKDAPELQPFFKMLRMGVPLEAVKLKMSLSALNPDLLDMPEANYDTGK